MSARHRTNKKPNTHKEDKAHRKLTNQRARKTCRALAHAVAAGQADPDAVLFPKSPTTSGWETY